MIREINEIKTKSQSLFYILIAKCRQHYQRVIVSLLVRASRRRLYCSPVILSHSTVSAPRKYNAPFAVFPSLCPLALRAISPIGKQTTSSGGGNGTCAHFAPPNWTCSRLHWRSLRLFQLRKSLDKNANWQALEKRVKKCFNLAML